MIEQYLDLQRLRSDHPEAIEIKVTGDPAHRPIAPHLLLPLVENSFKHGGNPGSGLPEVRVILDLSRNHLSVRISNPLDPDAGRPPEKQGGVGIANLKRRLELIYPGRHTFRIQQENQIFMVNLEIDR